MANQSLLLQQPKVKAQSSVTAPGTFGTYRERIPTPSELELQLAQLNQPGSRSLMGAAVGALLAAALAEMNERDPGPTALLGALAGGGLGFLQNRRMNERNRQAAEVKIQQALENNQAFGNLVQSFQDMAANRRLNMLGNEGVNANLVPEPNFGSAVTEDQLRLMYDQYGENLKAGQTPVVGFGAERLRQGAYKDATTHPALSGTPSSVLPFLNLNPQSKPNTPTQRPASVPVVPGQPVPMTVLPESGTPGEPITLRGNAIQEVLPTAEDLRQAKYLVPTGTSADEIRAMVDATEAPSKIARNVADARKAEVDAYTSIQLLGPQVEELKSRVVRNLREPARNPNDVAFVNDLLRNNQISLGDAMTFLKPGQQTTITVYANGVDGNKVVTFKDPKTGKQVRLYKGKPLQPGQYQDVTVGSKEADVFRQILMEALKDTGKGGR